MGASCHEFKIELMDDIHTFFRRTGLVRSYQELAWLGFDLDYYTGAFRQSHINLLIEFCEKNKEYHIVTQTHPGRYENRYIPANRNYFLAKGDKNPGLVLNPLIKKNGELFAQEMLDKAFAIFANIDRDGKGE